MRPKGRWRTRAGVRPSDRDRCARERRNHKMNEERQIRNRILIAEDDPISRRMLEAFLVKAGFQVMIASDGLEALRVLEKEDAPTLAVLDWMMPGLEGPQVCQRVRKQVDRPYVYILLLTARSQKGDLLHGLESGADDYLTKPFDAQELRARLHVGQRILDLQDGLIAAREELRFRATHDLLTGIWNRGSALDAIHREKSRQVREGGSFGVILIDVDHFKQVNDTYGHLCGDEVLKEVAARMARCVRPYDTLGRYGGEEFLVVAPSSDGQGALSGRKNPPIDRFGAHKYRGRSCAHHCELRDIRERSGGDVGFAGTPSYCR